MKKSEREEKEKQRIHDMYLYERGLTADRSLVFGVDEAGRGPLCGPVVAACCFLDPLDEILYVNDSKKLSEKKREELFDEITDRALAYGIGNAGPERIDSINILNATYEAMTEAWTNCLSMLRESGNAVPEETMLVLIDGNRSVAGIRAEQKTVVHGDALCPSIAAASILAKVTRDRLLLQYDSMWPQYGFAKNKGYGTAQHIAALQKYGPLPIHRKSFITKFI